MKHKKKKNLKWSCLLDYVMIRLCHDHTEISALVLNVLVVLPDIPVQNKAGKLVG